MDVQINDIANDPRGSLWRKWDLHFHTPSSYDYKDMSVTNEKIISTLAENAISVVAITDHNVIDVNRITHLHTLGANKGIQIFPGIELCSELGGSEKIHFVGIFPEDCDLENIWINIQSKLGLTLSDIKQKGIEKIYCDLKDSAKVIHELGGLVTVHAGKKSNSIENIKNNHEYKLQIKTDLIQESINILEIGNPRVDIRGYHEIVFPSIKSVLPIIIGSDNHNVKEYTLKYNCWIKADTTFEGLKEILYEPTERVYIGEEPQILKRVNENKEKYIEMLRINGIQGRQPKKGKWFQNVEIKLNKELVAIIGNKGCGKSAISDILGLLGNAHDAGQDQKNFSFLNNVSSKKRFRQTGFSENFEAEIIWTDTNNIKRSLNENVDFNQVQKVKYLPQNYFEKITNELELEEFEMNLKNVIFSHVPDALRLGKNTFDELEKYKSSSIQSDLQIQINELEKIIHSLAQLERRHHKSNISRIQSALESRQNDLDAHNKSKPEEPKLPDQVKSEEIIKNTEQVNKKIDGLKKEMDQVESKIIEAQECLKKLNVEKEELRQIVDDIQRHESIIKKYKSDSKELFNKFGFDIDQLMKSEFDSEPVKKMIQVKQTEIDKYEPLLKTNELIEYETGSNLLLKSELKEKSLVVKKANIQNELKSLVEQLSKPEKEFQEKKAAYNKWLTKKNVIEGDKNNPDLVPGSIENIKKDLKYLTDEVPKLILTERENAKTKACDILAKKNEILNLYTEFKNAVDTLLAQDTEYMLKFPIKVDVGYKLKSNFQKNFLDYINKTKSGTFIRNGEKILSDIVEGIDFSHEKNLKKILTTTLRYLDQDQRQEVNDKDRSIIDQISEVENFYKFLFSLSYLEPTYELKYDDKKLDELSPGEKGALLIVFYLMIDKGNIPLIIDQPEDNLDNQSVFDVLRHFIVHAKKRRQIIIVTHNPNLAVGADAEQIIYVNLDKKNNYEFSYKTGSIENPEINKELVRILEGTMPAFDKRKLKYHQN